jgi:hypothetical protein
MRTLSFKDDNKNSNFSQHLTENGPSFGKINFHSVFYGKGNENHPLGTGFFVHQKTGPAVKTVEFVSYRMS